MALAEPLTEPQARRVLILMCAGYGAVLLGAVLTAASGSLFPSVIGFVAMTFGVDRAVRGVVGGRWRHVFTRSGTVEAAEAADWDRPITLLALRTLPGLAVGVALAVLVRYLLRAGGVL